MRRHTDEPTGPMRRREDELEELLEHGSRNFRQYRRRAYAAFVGLALMSAAAIFMVSQKVDSQAVDARVARAEARAAKDLAASQRQGRQIAIGITCGATSAIIAAGRATITGGGNLPPELERNLRRLGYPPRSVREASARRAAEAYSSSIANAIEKQSGVKGIVRSDGSLDCDRVKVASRAQP